MISSFWNKEALMTFIPDVYVNQFDFFKDVYIYDGHDSYGIKHIEPIPKIIIDYRCFGLELEPPNIIITFDEYRTVIRDIKIKTILND